MKTILRNFWITITRFKLATTLNIIGLAIAFSVFTIIMIQTYWEFTYDKCYKDYDRIFICETSVMDGDAKSAYLSRPLGEQIANETSVIVQHSAVKIFGSLSFRILDKQNQMVNQTAKCMFVSEEFPEMFSLECVSGDFSLMKDELQVLISQSTAKQLFGDEDPLGRLIFASWDTLSVAAVYADLPDNSTFSNGIIVNVGQDNINDRDEWSYFYLYKAATPEAIKTIKTDIAKTLTSYLGDDKIKSNSQQDIENLISITPIENYYFDGVDTQGNRMLSYTLIAIAFLIIGIAVINFINFFMALVPIRIRSVNINKVFGTPTSSLRLNLASEAFGIVIISFLLSLLIIDALKGSYIADFMKCSIAISQNIPVIILTSVIALFVGVISGLYPAYYITKFPPMMVIQGSFGRSKSGRHLRSTLVTIQFIISITLIICSLFVNLQTSFLRNADMGFNRNRLITVGVGGKIASQPGTFLNLLKQNPDIIDVSYSDRNILNTRMGWGRKLNGQEIYMTCLPVSWNFPEFMGFKLIEGRYFIESDATKTNGTMIINESMAKKYAIKVGDFIPGHSSEDPSEVVGIVKNFNYGSAKNIIGPMVLYEFGSDGWRIPSVANIRITPTAEYQEVAATIKSAIKALLPNVPDDQIVIQTLDEKVENIYQQEQNIASIISLFSFVAILISLVGIFGLVIFEIQYRRKEIALRKVHGATSMSIPVMINKTFVRITIISSLIAIPLAYIGTWYWLQDFALRIPLYWWVAPIAVVLVWIITVTIITVQTLKAAYENPIQSLKND